MVYKSDDKTTDRFIRIWFLLEKIGMAVLILALVSVIAAQVLMNQSHLQDKLQVAENWYGEDYQTVIPAGIDDTALFGNIVVAIDGYTSLPDAALLINGKQAGTFTKQELTLRVYSGDVLELDTSAYNLPITFRITKASSNINTNMLESKVTVNCTRKYLGKVIFK